jgi:hypothetical protein
MLAGAPLIGAPWADRSVPLLAWGISTYLVVTAVVVLRNRNAKPVTTPASAPEAINDGPEDLARLTEEALKYLRAPAQLARCALANRIPNVLAQAHAASVSPGSMPTPLEKARLLRSVIEESMETLRLASGDEPGALQYAILHSEYVLGLPNGAIMSRHSVSESTFHRSRRAGVRALASELQARESRLVQIASK